MEGEFYIATTHKSCFYIKISKTIQKIVAAFRGMPMSPAKHSFGKCNRRTDRQTDGQTDGRRTK